jgi:glutathione S-transferase
MNQVIGIIDSYGYGSIIGKLVWQRMIVPMLGGLGDEAIVRDARPMVGQCLSEFNRIKGDDQFLAGPEVSLADLYLAPIFAYLMMTPDADKVLQPDAGLRSWWEGMSGRASMQKTQPKLG